MRQELSVQGNTCKACGLPYGNPAPEQSQSRFYCRRCANLPHNVTAILELHTKQFAERTQKVEATLPSGPGRYQDNNPG